MASTESRDNEEGLGEVVAQHYNNLEEKGLEKRTESRIFYMRNFNNWIKSMLIGDFLEKIKDNKVDGAEVKVLDMCCGKGGDLLKWKKGEIDYLVGADIAATSIEQCQSRYDDTWGRGGFNQQKRFGAQFITADCTKERLKDKYVKQNLQFDLTSCQFSFHYSFESIAQVDQMLQNAAECLRPGGYFIGTTPDSNEIVKRLRASDSSKFGNEVYSITFPGEEKLPLFGCRYDFHLEDVVDCPEFLVYFPLLERMAVKHDLKLVYKRRFDRYCQEKIGEGGNRSRGQEDSRQLLGKMQALETFPAWEGGELVGKQEDYTHAQEFLRSQQDDRASNQKLGTLSKAEWEAVCLYLVFAFQKTESRGVKRSLEDDS